MLIISFYTTVVHTTSHNLILVQALTETDLNL